MMRPDSRHWSTMPRGERRRQPTAAWARMPLPCSICRSEERLQWAPLPTCFSWPIRVFPGRPHHFVAWMRAGSRPAHHVRRLLVFTTPAFRATFEWAKSSLDRQLNEQGAMQPERRGHRIRTLLSGFCAPPTSRQPFTTPPSPHGDVFSSGPRRRAGGPSAPRVAGCAARAPGPLFLLRRHRARGLQGTASPSLATNSVRSRLVDCRHDSVPAW